MKKNWKIILIAILMLPMVVFFNGCSCSCSAAQNESNISSTDKNATFTVKFYLGIDDSNEAKKSYIAPQTVKYGQLINKPKDPIWSGHILVCWSQSPDPNNYTPWEFSINTVTSDTTLYAKWKDRPIY